MRQASMTIRNVLATWKGMTLVARIHSTWGFSPTSTPVRPRSPSGFSTPPVLSRP